MVKIKFQTILNSFGSRCKVIVIKKELKKRENWIGASTSSLIVNWWAHLSVISGYLLNKHICTEKQTFRCRSALPALGRMLQDMSLSEKMKSILQVSVGMATESNRKMHMAFKCFLWNWLRLVKGLCLRCVRFCSAPLCLSLVPSSFVASSNQNIMRAKRGCISIARVVWILWGQKTYREKRKIFLCPAWSEATSTETTPLRSGLLSRHKLKSPLCASATHRRDPLCLHISQDPSLPPHGRLSFSPMPAPIQKLGTPWKQLQQGFQCSSREQRDAPGPCSPASSHRPLCLSVCVCLHVYVTFPLAQDSLFIKATNKSWSRNHVFWCANIQVNWLICGLWIIIRSSLCWLIFLFVA